MARPGTTWVPASLKSGLKCIASGSRPGLAWHDPTGAVEGRAAGGVRVQDGAQSLPDRDRWARRRPGLSLIHNLRLRRPYAGRFSLTLPHPTQTIHSHLDFDPLLLILVILTHHNH